MLSPDFKNVCEWGDSDSHSILFSREGCDGYTFKIIKREREYKKPLTTIIIGMRDIAERIVTEKYDFSQEDLLNLNKCGVLFHIVERLKEKFR